MREKTPEELHWDKKMQIYFTSVFGKALEYTYLEIEKGIETLENFEKTFEKWWKRLLRLLVEKEKSFRNEYWDLRKRSN